MCSVAGTHRLIYSEACSILPCPLHWQAESLPLSLQGSPRKCRSFCVVESLVFWFYNWYLCYGVLNRVYYFILFLLWGNFIILWYNQARVPQLLSLHTLGLGAGEVATTEPPSSLEPVVHSKRSHHSEKSVLCN